MTGPVTDPCRVASASRHACVGLRSAYDCSMSGTEPGDGAGHGDTGVYPFPVVSVRLGEIRAFRITDDENEPVLVVSDGEMSVEFACGLHGLSGSAVRGAQRLADAARDYASAIEACLSR